MKKEMVVIYTWLSTGHLLPMVGFAKLLSKNGISVTVIVAESIPDPLSLKTFSGLSLANPSISFHLIPFTSVPSPSWGFAGLLERIGHANTSLTYLLQSLSETCSIRVLVIDFFITYALDVARKLNIPAYFFFCSGTSVLALYLHLPVLDLTIDLNFKDMGNTLIELPGLPPIPASHMPDLVESRDDPTYWCLMYHFARLPKGDGIIVNTFESLEETATEAVRNGLCLPDSDTPPIYCVGPLLSEGEKNKKQDKHECLTWLDKQPKKSVIFISFGSMGSLPIKQLTEIAIGLENSCQRFIWVVRSPPRNDPSIRFDPTAPPLDDFNGVLPDGFLDQTKDRGMVVKSWAPQVEILNHPSTGGFVTHCGWNSVLEAITAGVPIVCWPLYAEQRVNKILLVGEMKVAVEMKGYDEDLVFAKEVEEKVRLIIEYEEGNVIREKVEGLKAKATLAMRENGSSKMALMDFLAAITVNC